MIGVRGSIRDGERTEAYDNDSEKPCRLVIGANVNIEQNVNAAGRRIVIADDVCAAARTTMFNSTLPYGEPGEGNRDHSSTSGVAFVNIGRSRPAEWWSFSTLCGSVVLV